MVTIFQSCDGRASRCAGQVHRLRLGRNCRVLARLEEELLLLGDEHPTSSGASHHWVHHWSWSGSSGDWSWCCCLLFRKEKFFFSFCQRPTAKDQGITWVLVVVHLIASFPRLSEISLKIFRGSRVLNLWPFASLSITLSTESQWPR